jgi:hypothetical protein
MTRVLGRFLLALCCAALMLGCGESGGSNLCD